MPLSMYPAVGAQGPTKPQDPLGALAQLLGVAPDDVGGGMTGGSGVATETPSAEFKPQSYTFAGKVPTQGELSSPFEQQQASDVAGMHKAEHDRNAFAQWLSDQQSDASKQQRADALNAEVTKAQAAPKIAAQSALDVEGLKAKAEQYKADQGVEATRIKVEDAASKPKKLSNTEQATLDATHAMTNLGEPLLQKYEQKYPGIGADPGKFGSAFDALTAKFGKGFYSFGGMTENDPLLQESAAVQAWGLRQLAQGRINKSMMDIINAHLPQPGFSPGANYDRLSRLLHDVLPAQIQGIGQAQTFDPEHPMAGFPTTPTEDPNDPSTWKRVP